MMIEVFLFKIISPLEHVSYIWEIEENYLMICKCSFLCNFNNWRIKLIYLFWLIVGLFICWQLHDLFKLVFEKSTLKNNIFIEQYLPSLILLWYFLLI